MRITTNMLSSGYMRNINNNLGQLQKYEYQLSSQKKLTKLSDDPIGIIKSMEARVKLANVKKYQENVGNAQTWMTQSETALDELNDVVTKVYEASLEAATDTVDPNDRKAIAALVKEMRDHVLTVGNAKLGEKYIFGGYNTSASPFTVDNVTGKVLYNGIDMSDASNAALLAEDAQTIQYEIGYNMKTDVSMTGTKLLGMGEENLYNLMNDLYNALESNASASELAEYSSKLLDAQSRTLSNLAEIGGKTNRLKLMENRYSVDEVNFTEIKSKVEDIDVAETTVQWQTAMAVYNYALKIGSSILQTSLVDYLN